MSTDYYFACHDCKKAIHVAQIGMSGFSFYSGEKDCMDKLRAFMEAHVMSECNGKSFAIVSEQSYEADFYEEIDWERK